MNISHSKATLYLECSKKFQYMYLDKLKPISKGASLFFGTAVDESIQAYLKDPNSNYQEVFQKFWTTANDLGKKIDLYDSLNVDFSYKDYDIDLLTFEDIEIAKASQKELLPNFQGTWEEAKEYVTTRKKQRAHLSFTENECRYFNRLSWMSLLRKGLLMVKAFADEVGPKINKVYYIQKKVQLSSDTGDSLVGYVDMVIDLEGEGTVIIDLKTSASEYIQQDLTSSQQLGVYASILGAELNSYKVGYIVLLKNIEKNKEKICSKCGFEGQGSHKTCNNEATGKRCGSEWNTKLKLKGRVQILTETLTEDNMSAILDTIGGVTEAMKQGLYFRNPNACQNFNGCQYFQHCWKNDSTGLVKEE